MRALRISDGQPVAVKMIQLVDSITAKARHEIGCEIQALTLLVKDSC